MKSRLFIMCAMTAILLCLFACAPAAKQLSVDVSCDDFMEQNHITKEISVAAGDSLTVTLCSNATTGFQWSESAQVSDQAVLKQTAHELIAPEEGDGPPLVGAAGQEVWTFKALQKGQSTVSMEYGRPWEGGEKGEWTFTLTVVVK